MRRSKNWKDNAKSRDARRYGKRNTLRYESPFMTLDTRYLREED